MVTAAKESLAYEVWYINLLNWYNCKLNYTIKTKIYEI